MKKTSDLKLIVFFTALTFLLTVVVVLSWERFLLPPFFSWVESHYPGPANAEARVKVQQRVEHFFISIAVDMVVVTLLLRVVRRQHRRVEESEERYRALFEHAKNGIGVARASDFRLVEANGKFCDILGCQVEALVGRDVRELLRAEGDGPDPRRGGLAWLLGSAEAGEGEFVVAAVSGAPVHISVSFSTLSTAAEKLIMLIVRDLTQQRQLEADKEEMQRQLYQSSKLASIGELSAGVAHEINNPLNGLINFAQLLKDEPVERSDFERQMIDGIIDEGGRIARIVRGLLTFARPDGDGHEARRAHVGETVQTSVALFGRQLEKDGVRVEVELDPDLPPVRAEASRLRQVVVNMISNAHLALKARGGGGEKVFRISARRFERDGARCVGLEFYDNGVGIPAGLLDRVFDPFFTTRRDAGGTGLGLSISFGIVRDYGGTIRAESREGEFTRFTVELPAADSWEAEYG
ncbi:MAG TPA: ATP-binding protein [Pyrinomonadaceae bacterium]|nr:ATP-binding protein [Pyrinomonadaceae bacterium]